MPHKIKVLVTLDRDSAGNLHLTAWSTANEESIEFDFLDLTEREDAARALETILDEDELEYDYKIL